ncbi:MAG: DinB family protein [Rhodospirillaceae bacterium]
MSQAVQARPESNDAPIKVYWQPGCSSCLKTKEFLLEHGIPFVSVNVLEDKKGFAELAALGIRHIPIVARGDKWANGAVFRDVAKVAGFDYDGHKMLTPAQMKDKVLQNISAVHRYLTQIPEESLDTLLPGRPRSYRQLCYHVFNIPEVFLDRVENDAPFTYGALKSVLPSELKTKQDLLDFGQSIHDRFQAWFERDGDTIDFKQPGKVYYGEVTLHEVLERTGWHTGQHTRQVILMMREKLGIEPNGPLDDSHFEGLPMPKNVWDNERSFDEASWDGQAES